MIGHAFRTLRRYLQTPAARTADELGHAIEDEISFHIAERTREYTAKGMSEEDAYRAALQRFGDVSRIAAECHTAAVSGVAIWHRLHLGMTAVLAVAVGTLWFTSAARVSNPLQLASELPPGIASMLDNDWTGDITGQLLDERRQPIAAAHVLVVVKTWPDQSYFQRAYTALTDEHGRFGVANVHPINEQYEVQIAALAENRVLKSAYYSRTAGELKPLVFELPPSSGFALQVEAERGAALPGVAVLPHGRTEASGEEHLVYFDSAQSLIKQTDEDGRVDLPYFEPGDTASLLLRTPEGDWEPWEITVPARGEVATIRPHLNSAQNAKYSLEES